MGNDFSTTAVSGIIPFKPGVSDTKIVKDKIAIIDGFETPISKTYGNETPSHGGLVKRIIEEGLPFSSIDTFSAENDKGDISYPKMEKSLNELIDKQNKGEKYDAINISLSYDMSYEKLSAIMGTKITPQNLAENKSKIRDFIKNSFGYGFQYQLIEKIDKIAAKSPVYIAAGNDENKSFNIYSLAKNVNNVGGIDELKKHDIDLNDNSLVNKYADCFLDARLVRNQKGKTVGIDCTGDGTIDLKANSTSDNNFFAFRARLRGTSFASPKALVNDLQQKNQ